MPPNERQIARLKRLYVVGGSNAHHMKERVFANVSRNHPDYGLTVEEHEAAKAARQSQK